jgi:branched-chain amino acid transport system ATP-binding protein
MGIEPIAPALPSELSEGQRKLVGLARAVVGAPRLLCLDEPAAGMDTGESRVLGQRLRELAVIAAYLGGAATPAQVVNPST